MDLVNEKESAEVRKQGRTKKTVKRMRQIHEFIAKSSGRGYSPTVREIGEGLGISSTSVIHSCLQYLKEDGLVESEERRPRTLRIVRPFPDEYPTPVRRSPDSFPTDSRSEE